MQAPWRTLLAFYTADAEAEKLKHPVNNMYNKLKEKEIKIMLPVRRFAEQNWLPSVFNDLFGNEWLPRVSATSPSVNILEDEQEYKIEVAAPGMTKDDFNVQVNDGNEMVISMEKKSENGEKDKDGKRYLRREFSYSSYKQTFTLPDNVDKDAIKAGVDNGVLTVSLPKLNEEQKKESCRCIEIK